MNQTIETYNKAADAYAQKFNSIGSRRADIERAYALFGNHEKPKVVEWGCGNGRDAAVILEYTPDYFGIDASKEMITLARTTAPKARFEVADISSFQLPLKTDIVFAFASLLHFDKETVRQILAQAHARMSPNGIIYISLKRASYEERVVTDDYGPRTFYFYQKQDVEACIGDLYEVAFYDEQNLKGVDWLTIALRKK